MSITAKIVNIVSSGKRFITGTEWTDIAGKLRRSLDVNARILDESGNAVPVGSATDPLNVEALLKDSTGNEIEFSQVQTHTFHDAAVAVADGVVFECDGEYNKLVVEITTESAATQEIDFLGSVEGTNYYPLLGAKVGTDGSITTNVKTTSVTSEMWEIDITNRKYIKMDLATLTGEGATVTVVGVVS